MFLLPKHMKIAISIAVGILVFGLATVIGCSRDVPAPVVDPISIRDLDSPKPREPEKKIMYLTVPKMKKVHNLPVYTAGPGGWDKALKTSAVHVKRSGFPWESNANVYIAGHRLGFKDESSWKVFDDLRDLADGDKVYLKDSDGTVYTYKVYKEFVVGPKDGWVMNPNGKDIVTLQTCTAPNYTKRIIVRAEQVEIREAG